MNKENLIDTIDDIVPKENQIHLDLPKTAVVTHCAKPMKPQDEYQTLLKDLILMALPSPSQHVH
jgi:hypothetical protein